MAVDDFAPAPRPQHPPATASDSTGGKGRVEQLLGNALAPLSIHNMSSGGKWNEHARASKQKQQTTMCDQQNFQGLQDTYAGSRS